MSTSTAASRAFIRGGERLMQFLRRTGARVQTLVDQDGAPTGRTQHLCSVRKPGVATRLLAMAVDPRPGLEMLFLVFGK